MNPSMRKTPKLSLEDRIILSETKALYQEIKKREATQREARNERRRAIYSEKRKTP